MKLFGKKKDEEMGTPQESNQIDYKYSEDRILKELKEYVDQTYSQHYSQNKYQATEFILDSGHGEGFCIGNILKYAQRYGKKGSREDARKDLLKVLHYGIIALFNHDKNRWPSWWLYTLDRLYMKEDYKVNPLSIKVDQRKQDTRRDAWDRDYMGSHYVKSEPISNKRIDNAKPVFIFAFFYICILVMIDSMR